MEQNTNMGQNGNGSQVPPQNMNMGQPGYGGQMAPPVVDETKSLGILCLVFAFLMPLVGLILGIIGYNKVKEVEARGVIAEGATLIQAGLIISGILMALGVMGVIFGALMLSSMTSMFAG